MSKPVQSKRRRPPTAAPRRPPRPIAPASAPVPPTPMVFLQNGRTNPRHARHDSLETMRGLFADAQQRAAARSRSLSRRMHDQLIQQLTAASIELALTRRAASPLVPREIEESFALISRLIDQVMEQTRAIRSALHPDTLECFGLTAALQSLLREHQQKNGWKISGSIAEATLDTWPQQVLYLAAEELLHNAATHAQATALRVDVTDRQSACRLEIRDNGVGLPAHSPAWRPGCGLASVIENIRALGGSLEIESAPGRGTAIRVELPKTKCPRPGS